MAGCRPAGRGLIPGVSVQKNGEKRERENVFSLIGLEEPKRDVRVLVVRDEDHSLPRSG
jgi:hypothetical protein